MRVTPIRFPLVEFSAWLRQKGASDSTQIGYVARVRAVLAALNSPSDTPADVIASATPGEVSEYLGCLATSARVQCVSAWRAFAAFLREGGLELALPEASRPRASLAGPLEAAPAPVDNIHGLPLTVAGALWEVVDVYRDSRLPLTPGLVMALLWRNFRLTGGSTPRTAVHVEVHIRGGVYAYTRPLARWCVLWDWARGEREAPEPTQPLVPDVCGGGKSITGDVLHAVLTAGKRDRLPAVVDQTPIAPLSPPPPPVPTSIPLSASAEQATLRLPLSRPDDDPLDMEE